MSLPSWSSGSFIEIESVVPATDLLAASLDTIIAIQLPFGRLSKLHQIDSLNFKWHGVLFSTSYVLCALSLVVSWTCLKGPHKIQKKKLAIMFQPFTLQPVPQHHLLLTIPRVSDLTQRFCLVLLAVTWLDLSDTTPGSSLRDPCYATRASAFPCSTTCRDCDSYAWPRGEDLRRSFANFPWSSWCEGGSCRLEN